MKMSDIEQMIIKKALMGDLDSFEKLVKQYENKVFSICFRYLGNREDALDAAQDTFIKVYKSLDKYKFEYAFNVWILTIASNTSKDYLKKRKDMFYIDSYSVDNQEETGFEIKDETALPEKELINKEKTNDITMALMELKDDVKEAIILRDVSGLSYSQIAQSIGIPIGTVRSRIHRGRTELKQIIMEKYPHLVQA
jgi:RNA polymerase sigma-70 factor (ECF subfamily)